MAAERPAWSNAAAAVVAEPGSDAQAGLTSEEALRRLRTLGPSQLVARERRHILSLPVDQFRSVVVLLLVAVGVPAKADYRQRWRSPDSPITRLAESRPRLLVRPCRQAL